MNRSGTLLGGGAPAAAAPAVPAAAATRRLWLVLVLLSALRVLYLAWGSLDLSPDEAHYWEWSRRLDLSYYSKGPLIAYLIRALTTVFGTSMLAIRLGAVVLSVVGSLVLYRLAREAFGDPRPGLLAVVGLQLTPLFWAGSLLLTIDAPFLVCWTVALLALHRALVGGTPRAWLLAGAALGVGLLAKYTMLFILPGLALYLWRAPEARRSLARPAAWAGAVVAAVLFAPVVVWNLERGWVSARHVASQGTGQGLTWVEPLDFGGGQVLILTPLVAGLLAWGSWYAVREGLVRGREPYRFLTAFAVPVVGFYLLLSFQGKIQANWAAVAYPSLALAAAGALLERGGRLGPEGRRRQRWLLGAAAAVAVGVSALGHATDRLPVPPRLDPTTRLKGWQTLGDVVGALRREMPAPARTFLVSDRYQITSELAFYVEGRPPAYNVNLGRRLNQYDFWEGPDTRKGWDALWVQEGVDELDPRVSEAFGRTEGPFVVEIRRGDRTVRRFAVYRGYGFRGLATPAGRTTY